MPSKESERAETPPSKGTEELTEATSCNTEVDKSQQSKGSFNLILITSGSYLIISVPVSKEPEDSAPASKKLEDLAESSKKSEGQVAASKELEISSTTKKHSLDITSQPNPSTTKEPTVDEPSPQSLPNSGTGLSGLSESLVALDSSALLASQLSSLPPGPSSQSSILTAKPVNSSPGGLLDFLSNMPCGNILDEEVFDPETFEKDISYESDEGEMFRQKAFSATKETPVKMVRTRSQTSQSGSGDMTGKLVFAHKGKTIPCWFPRRVVKKTKKGIEVQFFSEFGVEICTEKNIMLYDDYFLKKADSTSTLFKVPSKLQAKFDEGLNSASSK